MGRGGRPLSCPFLSLPVKGSDGAKIEPLGGGQVRVANSWKNKAALGDIVKRGPSPGLLALDGGLAVGWCQVTPRDVLPRLERSRIAARLDGADDRDVWSVSCFYIRRGYRREGVMTALIDAAVQRATAQGAAGSLSLGWKGRRSAAGVYTGIRSAFTKAGFEEVARRGADRSTMRHSLQTR